MVLDPHYVGERNKPMYESIEIEECEMSSRQVSPAATKEFIYQRAREVFGTVDKVYSWMNTSNPCLKGMRPVDFIDYGSEQDLKLVIDELGRIDQGIFWVRVFRLANPRWITVHSGSGIAARWNREGARMIYTTSSLALGLLEMLVHLKPNQLPDYSWISTEIPLSLTQELNETPDDPAAYGTAWLSQPGSSVGLIVPSVIVPEVNVLLNPAHSDFASLHWSNPMPLKVDPRLLG
jgi:RES domain-containing protein